MVEQIKGIGQNPRIVEQTIEEATRQTEKELAELQAERRSHERELAAKGCGRLTDLTQRIERAEKRLAEITAEEAKLAKTQIYPDEAIAAVAAFTPIWDTLTPKEQTRFVQLLIARVDYDGEEGKVAVTFKAKGFSVVADEYAEAAA